MAKTKKVMDTKEAEKSLSYKGEVTVSIVRGNRVCSKRKFKNSGFIPLSLFFSLCLSGDYGLAENHRPQYIRLYHLGNEGTTKEQESTYKVGLGTTYPNVLLVVPQYNTTPGINVVDGGWYTTTLKFLIPFTQVQSGAGDINGLCLYSINDKENLTNPSAMFIVNYVDDTTGKEDTSKLGSLVDTSAVSGKEDEYNIQIQWEMSVK